METHSILFKSFIMTVSNDLIVSLAYTVREGSERGPIVEQMDSMYPFRFYFGNSKLLPAFEAALEGLAEGDRFAFQLSAEQAYGPVEPGNVIDVPINVFQENGEVPHGLLESGKYVALTDDLGHTHNGKICSWNKQTVQVDFNHILAGKDLHFSGVVLQVRQPTAEERQRRSYIEQGGVYSPK